MPVREVLQGQTPTEGSSDGGIVSNPDAVGKGGPKLSVGSRDMSWIDADIVGVKPENAMGATEQNAAGLAAAIERRQALRPWTRPDSPCDKAKPIAFDAADMSLFWKAVSGSVRNPHVQKGERIKGRKNAIGLNVGGTRIEIVSQLFGMVDRSDVEKLRADCRTDGFFRNEDPDWCAGRSKADVSREEQRSRDELEQRTRDLYARRVKSGEGGEHYATQVLGHEIGHTLANLPKDAALGPVGRPMKTILDAFTDKLKADSALSGRQKEVNGLIAWWHGTDTLPD